MGKVRKVQDRSIANRQKLVKAGSLLFAQKGVFHTNAKEIARTASLADSNFYTYYRSKLELFNEVVLSYYKQVEESTSAILFELSQANVDKKAVLKDFYKEQMKFVHYTDRIFEDYNRLDEDKRTVTDEIKNIKNSIRKDLESFLLETPYIKQGADSSIVALMIISAHIPHIKNIISLTAPAKQDKYIDTLVNAYIRMLEI